MQYKKLFTIPFIALSLFSTACAVQSGNVVGKESIYPPVANFSFEIKIKPLSDMDYQAVITNKKTKKIQIIESMSHPPLTADHLVQIQDLNNDGYPDIILKGFPVAASAINGNELYMFNPETKQFEETKDITQLGEIHASGKNCIYVDYRKNSMEYSQDHYCWRNGKWHFVKNR